MSLPKERVLGPGKLTVKLQDYNQGDVLPMHNHPYDESHITIIARGSFELRKPGTEPMKCHPGTYFDFKAHEDHSFVAMEDNSRLFNIYKFR